MLRSIMTQIVVIVAAKHHAVGTEKAGGFHLMGVGPSRRPIGFDLLCFARAPHRHADGYGRRDEPAGCGDIGALDENGRRISVVAIPPPEEGRRQVEGKAENPKPWLSEFRLEGEPPRDPFGRAPDADEDDGQYDEDLAPENFRG